MILQSGFLQTFIQGLSFIFENGVNSLLGDSCGREDFFFYLSCEGGNFHTFFLQKYVIKCLIMLYIFVFTMGQLLSVYELTVSGERRSVEWFKYRPNFFAEPRDPTQLRGLRGA